MENGVDNIEKGVEIKKFKEFFKKCYPHLMVDNLRKKKTTEKNESFSHGFYVNEKSKIS